MIYLPTMTEDWPGTFYNWPNTTALRDLIRFPKDHVRCRLSPGNGVKKIAGFNHSVLVQ
jgi:hypothetical protein